MFEVDPVKALRPHFEAALTAAFGAEYSQTDPMLQWSDRADLQSNVAMGLARKVGQNPRAVAENLLKHLSANDIIEKTELAGPGFINITLRTDWLAAGLSARLEDPRLGVPEATVRDTVVVDYSAPNVAKEMHVGHLRSSVIGDSLARLLEWRGHTVLRQNHIGDWGTPFGMLIEHLLDLGEEQTAAEVSVGELSAFYKAARKKFDSDSEFAERARNRVVSLQRGDEETLRLWRQLVELSAKYFEAIYDKLDVTLRREHVAGESSYNALLAPVAQELTDTGLAVMSDGALCVFPPGFKSKSGEPLPLIVRKSDEGFGYAATDLAAVKHRTQTLKATRMLYVVGAPQEQHFAMVFAVARMAGWLTDAIRVTHVAFGSVLGTDKQMYRTRSGDSVRLIDLIDEAIDRARQEVQAKSPHLDPQEQAQIARDVGVAAIKYADLSSDRVRDYVFDLERMTRAEGNTGPYLQYAHARTRSILRKALEQGHAVPVAHTPLAVGSEPAEKQLMLHLSRFGAAVESVESLLEPHKLCTYLYELASRFASFYDQCPVLRSEGDVRAGRLALVQATGDTLNVGMSLLGLRAPTRM
ncbi:MAG: arginine--tRNA ligase [Deltaproteobacteria bacterium]|nr:arginine--tRNA ligase [Deltaproteobacteria bacterium]